MKSSRIISAAIAAFTVFFGSLENGLAIDDFALPETVTIAPKDFQYRLSGEFLKNGYPVDAPLSKLRLQRPLQIMKYQVSAADYALCVADKACGKSFKPIKKDDVEKPIVGVSYFDAANYAKWLTKKTRTVWRLPSDTEWAFSAGSRFNDDALNVLDSASDPSKRGVQKYQQSTKRERGSNSTISNRGTFGANENKVFDQSGNIWEWTNTCYRRSTITDGRVTVVTENCGVRVVEGQHRSYMTNFIQDAKSGGCAVGTPPDYLGIRLVRDNPSPFSFRRARNWWQIFNGG